MGTVKKALSLGTGIGAGVGFGVVAFMLVLMLVGSCCFWSSLIILAFIL